MKIHSDYQFNIFRMKAYSTIGATIIRPDPVDRQKFYVAQIDDSAVRWEPVNFGEIIPQLTFAFPRLSEISVLQQVRAGVNKILGESPPDAQLRGTLEATREHRDDLRRLLFHSLGVEGKTA